MQGVAVAVILVVFVVAFLNARIYNFIFGFISLIGISALLALISFIGFKADMNTAKYDEAIQYVNWSVVTVYRDILSYFKMNKLADSGNWLFYVFPVGVFIIAFIISAFVKKLTKEK